MGYLRKRSAGVGLSITEAADALEQQFNERPRTTDKQRMGLSSADYARFKYGVLVGVHYQTCEDPECKGCKARPPVGNGEHKGRASGKKDRLRSELRYNEPGVGRVTKYGVPTNKGTFVQFSDRSQTGKLIIQGKVKDMYVMSGGAIPLPKHIKPSPGLPDPSSKFVSKDEGDDIRASIARMLAEQGKEFVRDPDGDVDGWHRYIIVDKD